MRKDHNFGRIGISDLESLYVGHFFDDPKFRNFNEFSASAEFGDLGVISEPARPGREFRSGRARSGSSGPAGHSWICFQNAPGFLEKPQIFSAGLENLLIFLIFLKIAVFSRFLNNCLPLNARLVMTPRPGWCHAALGIAIRMRKMENGS